jgi:hypothetical protein
MLLLAATALAFRSAPASYLDQAPPRTPAKPPAYDLAILRIQSTLRWQGGLDELARFDVELTNRGVRDILQVDVQCLVRGKTFRALNAGRALKRDELYEFTVQVSGREVFDWDPGRYEADCVARIVRPDGARDTSPENNAARGFVLVEPRPPTDLAIESIALRDCDGRGPAVAARPACAEVTYLNQGSGIVATWTVGCEVAGTRVTAPGTSPLEKGSMASTEVRFESLPAGEFDAACFVNADRTLAESREDNNRRGSKVLVLAGAQELRYDLAITGVASTLTEGRDPATRQPLVALEVRLRNLGSQPILRADVRCDLGTTGIVFESAGEQEFEPGEEGPLKVQVWGRRLSSRPDGTYEVTCVAGIVRPGSVIETDVENNAVTGTVVVRR